MVDLNAQLNKQLGIKDPVNDPSQTIPAEDNNKISTTRSVLSGLASGVFKIPEGFASLGASLIDLGLGTKSAESVEKFFADINPFDEAAEATTAGKITELVVNLGIPGGYAFKLGSNLAKEALLAKKAGKYLDVTGDVAGNLVGDVTGNVHGTVTGMLIGNVIGDVTGDVTGDITGNLLGNVIGNVTGNIVGDITTSNILSALSLQISAARNVELNIPMQLKAYDTSTRDTLSYRGLIYNSTSKMVQYYDGVTGLWQNCGLDNNNSVPRFRLPTYSAASIATLTAVQAGEVVFDTDALKAKVFDGTIWQDLW